MKVVLASGWTLPDSTGGTEIYVDSLARALIARGVDVHVVAPHAGQTIERQQVGSVPVWRFPLPAADRAEQARGERAPPAHAQFEALLEQLKPDVYHQHAWTLGMGLHHLESAARRGAKTFLTVHTPALHCRRGTLLEHGTRPCDGVVDDRRCARCHGQSRGAPAALAGALALVPTGWSRPLRSALPNRIGSAFGVRADIAFQREQIARAAVASRRVIAVCAWLEDALAANGVARDKLLRCRQGIADDVGAVSATPDDSELKLGFLGRFDPVKGLSALLEALSTLPAARRWSLEVVAPAPKDHDGNTERQRLLARWGSDPRVRFQTNLPRAQLADFFARIHALAVPSRWFETGPLVVLEAHAHGVPVLGTALGGIAELVKPGVNGTLVALDDHAGWVAALDALCAHPPRRLTETERFAVRRQSAVAAEMEALYVDV
jgi:glycosyltransferase involved in cell wall biosynthesis